MRTRVCMQRRLGVGPGLVLPRKLQSAWGRLSARLQPRGWQAEHHVLLRRYEDEVGHGESFRCEKRILRLFRLNQIILPRRTRDKHRESTQQESGVFSQAASSTAATSVCSSASSRRTIRRPARSSPPLTSCSGPRVCSRSTCRQMWITGVVPVGDLVVPTGTSRPRSTSSRRGWVRT